MKSDKSGLGWVTKFISSDSFLDAAFSFIVICGCRVLCPVLVMHAKGNINSASPKGGHRIIREITWLGCSGQTKVIDFVLWRVFDGHRWVCDSSVPLVSNQIRVGYQWSCRLVYLLLTGVSKCNLDSCLPVISSCAWDAGAIIRQENILLSLDYANGNAHEYETQCYWN